MVWKSDTRRDYARNRSGYASSTTDKEWERVLPQLPKEKAEAVPVNMTYAGSWMGFLSAAIRISVGHVARRPPPRERRPCAAARRPAPRSWADKAARRSAGSRSRSRATSSRPSGGCPACPTGRGTAAPRRPSACPSWEGRCRPRSKPRSAHRAPARARQALEPWPEPDRQTTASAPRSAAETGAWPKPDPERQARSTLLRSSGGRRPWQSSPSGPTRSACRLPRSRARRSATRYGFPSSLGSQ